VDVGPVATIIPYVLLCPSTPTLISSSILFIYGITKLNYLNRDDVWLTDMIPFILMATFMSIDWKRILVSVQIYMPIFIWIGSATSALLHPLFRCVAPGTYRKVVVRREAQREEYRRKRELKKLSMMGADAETGIPPEQEQTSRLVGEVTEETRLTGSISPEISGLLPARA